VAAIPNEIISQYREIAQKAKLEIVLMEAEMFGLVRALVAQDDTRPTCLIDIGIQSTVCSLIEKRVLKYSHSFDRGSRYLADEIANRLPVNHELARSIRENYGLKLISLVDPEIREKIMDILKESLAPIFREIDMMIADFRKTTNAEVAKMILSGGVLAVPEIRQQFNDYFATETEIADPFPNIDYRQDLAPYKKEIGLNYSVAMGMAQRVFDIAR
jgi:Tfp pilus assembly PilM family ATPase